MELFKILGKIAIDGADKAKKDITDVGDRASHTTEGLKKLGSGAATVAKVSLKAFVAATTATTAALGLLTKSAVKNYADYEQLVGGVETLFKDSSVKVMEYARQAY